MFSNRIFFGSEVIEQSVKYFKLKFVLKILEVIFKICYRWNASKEGWKSQVAPPPRKDFALFMRIQIIGSSNLSDSKRSGSMNTKDGIIA